MCGRRGEMCALRVCVVVVMDENPSEERDFLVTSC